MDGNLDNYRWDETNRRLDDSTSIRVTNVIGYGGKPIDGWVFVSIQAATGAPMFTGTMTMVQALTEIPFQLDRARAFDKAYEATRIDAQPAYAGERT